MKNRLNRKVFLLVAFCIAIVLCILSCGSEEEQQPIKSENTTHAVEMIQKADSSLNQRITPYLFKDFTPREIIDKTISVQEYVGAKEYAQPLKLFLYQEQRNLEDVYEGIELDKKVFETLENYKDFGLACVRGEFLYFHVIEHDGTNTVLCYSMEKNNEEVIFTYTGENQIAIRAVNDKYIIWQEDENANWLKVSLHCYDMATGQDKLFFVYSRDEMTGYMYSWNFNRIVLQNEVVYFDNTIDENANINLYKYDIKKDAVHCIAENRATDPIAYKGLSYLSFDDAKKEYILKNIDDSVSCVYIGDTYVKLYSAGSDILVGYTNGARDGIMYYENGISHPVLESAGNIDEIYCTDRFIVWDGWFNDAPLFFDIANKKIIRVNALNDGKRYKGYVTDQYLIFEAHEYIPDPTTSDGAITTKSMIYYFVKISKLQ